jgi:sigma-54 dependent transcriptional regulator, acetoin dehydrogenase operon transcriptional activator AcoR
LLLDEIVDLPLALQAKLLRVLEEHEVVPLGESTPVPVDVRIVTAAQRPLEEAVAERRYRADLCARLDGLAVRLPPLRERVEDVPALFALKLAEHAEHAPALDCRFVERLCLRDWPFNVREVDRLAWRTAALHPQESVLHTRHLPERYRAPERNAESRNPVANRPALSDEKPLGRDERDILCLLDALRRRQGNVARASSDAQISRQRAYRLMHARPDVKWREGDGRASAATTVGTARCR